MGVVDLHTHTTASDGKLTPTQLVQLAKKVGLVAVAITDHDTVEGIEEALQAGRRFGIEVVPGIELSTRYEDKDIHILGYFIDHRDREFRDALKRFQNIRLERAKRMVEKLKELGIEISIEDVLRFAKNAASIGRPHVAQAIVSRGYAHDIQDAFDKFIAHDRPAYVPKFKLNTLDGIEFIRRAGGVPVIAHPGLSTDPDFVEYLAKKRLISGIEVWHPEHTPEHVKIYYEIAERYRLIKTGGSDFHGTPDKPKLGESAVAYVSLAALKREKAILSTFVKPADFKSILNPTVFAIG